LSVERPWDNPDPNDPDSPSKPGFWQKPSNIIGASITGFVLILVVFAALGKDDGVDQTDARHACEDAVEASLKSPQSADFSFMDLSHTETSGGGWIISNTVTAENEYGIEKTLAFTCEVGPAGTVIDLSIDE